MEDADFSGWATRNDLKCSDGRTIRQGAFKHQDKTIVPLVWSHQQNDPFNILGYAVLEHRAEGVYTHGFFNDTDSGKQAKALVHSKNVRKLSIFANNLTQRSGNVMHGDIIEVSLVLAGANPGAVIENVNLMHSADDDTTDGEAIIHTGLDFDNLDPEAVIKHVDTKEPEMAEDKTVQDIWDNFSEEEQTVVHYLIGQALEDAAGDEDPADAEAKHSQLVEDLSGGILKHIQEDDTMRNVFQQNGVAAATIDRPHLSHADIKSILAEGNKRGSLRDAFLDLAPNMLAHAGGEAGVDYGITDLDLLFPDAKQLEATPQLLARQTEWVSKVLGATKHTPFAKVKSLVADLTAAEARAKGYVKGSEKQDEVVGLLRRTTSPTTIYKKQRLDRDDILDITDFDVIAWLKWEIRFMLNEEIARAILIGDGRTNLSPDKIKDPAGQTDGIGIRSIAHDHEMYAHKVELTANSADKALIEAIIRARKAYRGSGSPTFYTTDGVVTDLLLLEDKMGRPLYDTEAALAAKLRVKEIVAVEAMEEEENLLGIIVNLADYSVGTNKGGELTFFEDFDIDFNQEKYLMETRLSGGLTVPKSALVFWREEGTSATPAAPSFTGGDTVTITATTGVVYLINGVVKAAGAHTITEDADVKAEPAEGYYIPNGAVDHWYFTFTG